MKQDKVDAIPQEAAVLVIKLRQLGDVMMAGPAIAALRKKYPTGRIDVLTNDVYADFFRTDPLVDNVIAFEPKRSGSPFYYLGFLLKRLRQRYDVVVDLHNNPRSIIMAAFVRSRVKIGIKKTHNFFFSHRVKPLEGAHHTIDQLVHILSPLNVDAVSTPHLHIPEEIKSAVALRYGLVDKGFFVCCPGTNKPEFTRWMPEHFSGVIKHVIERGHKVVIVTGPGEDELARFFGDALDGGQKVQVIANELSAMELAAVISMAKFFIGNNSGPLHVASAVHTDAVGIFGPSSVTAWGVRGAKGIHFYKDVGCNPCRKKSCPSPVRKCLEAITPQMVIERLDDFL